MADTVDDFPLRVFLPLMMPVRRFQRATEFAGRALSYDPSSRQAKKLLEETIPLERKRELKRNKKFVKQVSSYLGQAMPDAAPF